MLPARNWTARLAVGLTSVTGSVIVQGTKRRLIIAAAQRHRAARHRGSTRLRAVRVNVTADVRGFS